MLKVLIIDDDAIVLFIQEKMLKKCEVSSNPFSFKDARKAIKFLQLQEPEHHFLILLDINMPLMNGWEFLESIKSLDINSRIKVLMVTSSIDGYDKKKASIYENVIGFIEKPISTENCLKIKEIPELQMFF